MFYAIIIVYNECLFNAHVYIIKPKGSLDLASNVISYSWVICLASSKASFKAEQITQE